MIAFLPFLKMEKMEKMENDLFSISSISSLFGTEMEKMRLAMDKQKERLSEYHKFQDDIVDQPFLTPDTAKD